MDSCPICHQPTESINYFCPNCGKNLQPAPLSTSLSTQISLYLKTLLLPPMGLIWGFRYLRQSDQKSKVIGLVVIIFTIIEIIWAIQSTVSIVNTVNKQVSQQINSYGL